MEESIAVALARTAYYRYILKVKWRPSYDILKKHYIVQIDDVVLRFVTSPFYDIENALLDYTRTVPLGSSEKYLDAGSYIGTFALYVAAISSNNSVVAVEPDPKNRELMSENIRINKLKNITIYEKGLWDKTSILDFVPNEGEMSGIQYAGDSRRATTTIKTTTIDEISRSIGHGFDYIKMDIEGAEIEALEGAKQTIRKYLPKFAIASYHIRDGKQTKESVEQFLHSYYKRVYSTNNGQLLTIALPD